MVTDFTERKVREKVGGEWTGPDNRGKFSHPHRRMHESGASVHFGSTIKTQPTVLEFPGEACERVSWQELARVGYDLAARVTRIDVAVDVQPAEEASSRLLEMRRLFRAGQCRTRIPKTSCEFIESDAEGGGRTCYFGSRSSAYFLRAYDRRGPLRLEFQIAPESRDYRARLPELLDEFAPVGLWRAYARRVVFPLTWYEQLIEGRACPAEAGTRVPSSLKEAVEVFNHQWGKQLYAFMLLGIPLEELAQEFAGRLHPEQQRTFLTWVREAAEEGLDGSGLLREVRACRR